MRQEKGGYVLVLGVADEEEMFCWASACARCVGCQAPISSAGGGWWWGWRQREVAERGLVKKR